MRPLEPTDPTDGPEFDASAVIRTCLEAAASTDKPIRVVQDGQLLGVVDRSRILGAVADTMGDRLLGVMSSGQPTTSGSAPGACPTA
jgi:glycine betaine/proline transport system ATP-binding protein